MEFEFRRVTIFAAEMWSFRPPNAIAVKTHVKKMDWAIWAKTQVLQSNDISAE